MNRYHAYTIIFLFPFLLVQCSPQHEPKQSFGELPVIEYQMVNLIGEDEHYIPGMLRRIFQLADGSWVISDHGSTTIEHFSADGEHVSTVAIQGEGPGEVRPFFFFHQFSDSIVVARQQMSNRLDFYKLNRRGDAIRGSTRAYGSGTPHNGRAAKGLRRSDYRFHPQAHNMKEIPS